MATSDSTMQCRVRVRMPRPGISKGNILWSGRWPMRGGVFPKGHPVGGGSEGPIEFGTGENIKRFRALGYWASCFPEGDGIVFETAREQSIEQVVADVRAAFGWFVEDWR